MGTTSLAVHATAESQHNATVAIQSRPTVVTPKDCDYFYMPLKACFLTSFDRKDSVLVNGVWGKLVNTFLGRISGTASKDECKVIQAFSGWHLPPSAEQIIRDKGKTPEEAKKYAKFLAKQGPLWMTLFVVDVVGDLGSPTLARAFDDFEYLCYQTTEGAGQGVDVVRFVFPLSFGMPVAKFERLRGTIQKWIDSRAGDQFSDPASYEIGRICAMPAAASDGAQHARGFYNPGGNTLNWTAFETMLETGSLEMVID